MERFDVADVLYIVAVVLFVLAAVTNGVAGGSPLDLAALGLAFFAAGHVSVAHRAA